MVATFIANATAETSPNAGYHRHFTFTLTATRTDEGLRLETEIYTHLRASGGYTQALFDRREVPNDVEEACQVAEEMEAKVRAFLDDEQVVDPEFPVLWADALEDALFSERAVQAIEAVSAKIAAGETEVFPFDVADRLIDDGHVPLDLLSPSARLED